MPFFVVWFLIDRLQAVLLGFACALARGSTVGNGDAGTSLNERFELFSSVMCDALVGWDAAQGREGKRSQRFLRMVLRHLLHEARARVESDGAAGDGAAREDADGEPAAAVPAASEQLDADHGAADGSAVDARVDVDILTSGVVVGEEGRAVSEDVVVTARAGGANHCEGADEIEETLASEALYLGVALEEQCTCEWSGLRIPAVLCGMLNALATPVDVMCEALSAAAVDDAAAAVVFAEVESRCVGRAGDAEAVCGAIVSGRSMYGAGLDVGLLRLWLKRLPDAVSQRDAAVVLTVAVVLFVLLILSVDVSVFVCAGCAGRAATAGC